ncbi:hypothetical protein [Falsirhodobacter sp. 20TX0035]|uniref:hypothetical protein n=1 Tax=Falsirhodobacter sp. 20TX0035 TaxID=3022019 RepID=UPI00232DA69B|nr:hypothetical protein [Falsirhodobacter sp. 20TX0035]MDB6455041.1 hypothetical protein [Falsirhodobacter sp. 20TX0035]
MPFQQEYRGYVIHLDDPASQLHPLSTWKITGYGREHASGDSITPLEALAAARAVIDKLETNPYRFPINLIGYPSQPEGDVVTRDGEVIGRWCFDPVLEELDCVDFYPNGASDPIFSGHFISLLCDEIRIWHECK